MEERTQALRPPGPPDLIPYFGHTFAVWRDLLGFFERAARDYGPIARFRFGPFEYVMANEPDAVKHVLVDNHRNYVKSRNYDGLKLLLGEGLVTSEGDFWRRQRKLAQPAFHRERLTHFADTMTRATQTMLDRWEREVAPRAPLDVHREMMRVTLDIVGRTLLSTDLDDRQGDIGRAMGSLLRDINEYTMMLVRLPRWLPTPMNFRLTRAMKTLDGFVRGIVRRRRELGARGDEEHDLLSMLLAARDEETHESMSDRQLKDEVMTIVTAGHETTANALTWTLFLLAKHPGVARRLHEELDAVLGPDRTAPTLADLPKLAYTTAVLQESMRLYPPVWSFERQALNDDVVAGYAVPKGAIVGLFPYLLRRDPRFWSDPQGFEPERFLSGKEAHRPRYAYVPFGGGPRTCIGNAFAMMEAQILLSMITRRYRLELAPGARVVPEPVVTLRPKHGLPMTLTPRWA